MSERRSPARKAGEPSTLTPSREVPGEAVPVLAAKAARTRNAVPQVALEGPDRNQSVGPSVENTGRRDRRSGSRNATPVPEFRSRKLRNVQTQTPAKWVSVRGRPGSAAPQKGAAGPSVASGKTAEKKFSAVLDQSVRLALTLHGEPRDLGACRKILSAALRSLGGPLPAPTPGPSRIGEVDPAAANMAATGAPRHPVGELGLGKGVVPSDGAGRARRGGCGGSESLLAQLARGVGEADRLSAQGAPIAGRRRQRRDAEDNPREQLPPLRRENPPKPLHPKKGEGMGPVPLVKSEGGPRRSANAEQASVAVVSPSKGPLVKPGIKTESSSGRPA
nr:MAG: hypothetical protein [Aedes japonicus narnavirus 1]